MNAQPNLVWCLKSVWEQQRYINSKTYKKLSARLKHNLFPFPFREKADCIIHKRMLFFLSTYNIVAATNHIVYVSMGAFSFAVLLPVVVIDDVCCSRFCLLGYLAFVTS